ncbi:hypothetical protein Angca_002908 [Angiostrongylus cantonensis]|nr:hypothetical protein Angca_002908 [Angiostrongylus cantonensis]
MMRHWTFICSCLLACDTYKFLINTPMFAYSHTNFMGAIADTLTEAGHNVTVLMPVMHVEQEDKTCLKLTKNVIKIPADPRVYELRRFKSETFSDVWMPDSSVFGLLKARFDLKHMFAKKLLKMHFLESLFQGRKNMTKSFVDLCEGAFHLRNLLNIIFSTINKHSSGVFNDEKLMKMLEKEKFDVGISEAFDICGLGIFEILKIPATIAAFSGVHMDSVSRTIGEPIMPTQWSREGDRMNFIGRFKNFLNMLLENIFFIQTYDEEIKAFRTKFGPQFKSYSELISKTSFVFTNSNPYLDYPRPVLHKTVAIGGITVSDDPKKMELKIFRKALLEVFETMPETTFIWKYEEEGSTIVGHLKNVYLSSWVPQNALLADSRLTVFITHGGLGSITELAHMGKPAILASRNYNISHVTELPLLLQIPIFADQARNANMFSKHGCGIFLTKDEFEYPQKLRDSLRKIFNNASFSENARLLSDILRNQPIGPKQLVVSYSEFAARFGTLPNLDPYGRHLSFLQYYLIDVLLACVFAFCFVVFAIFKLLRKCFSLREKSKTE